MPSWALLILSAFVGEGAGTGWTVKYAAYYSDVIRKNSAQCEEVHKEESTSTDEIAENSEIISLTGGSFAGVKAPQRLNAESLRHGNMSKFIVWLVGLTDADGGFTIEKSGEGKYVWVYFLDQNKYNEMILVYVKKILKIGNISDSGGGMRKYRIRDRKKLKEVIVPIFNGYPLLTSKRYRYELWLKGMEIMESSKGKEEKIREIKRIREKMKEIPKKYVSKDWESRLKKDWIVGFTEGDGSFYITKKEEGRWSPGFGISQKLDKEILEGIRKVFKIKAKVKEYERKYQLDTTNRRSLERIRDYFKGELIGKKRIEYILWEKAIRLGEEGKKEKVEKYMERLRRLRSTNPWYTSKYYGLEKGKEFAPNKETIKKD